MIQLNVQMHDPQERASREFTRVLQVLKRYLAVFKHNPETHRVEGILATSRGSCYRVHIDVDVVKKRIACHVQLRASDLEITQQSHVLLRLQHSLTGLAMVTFDKETHTFHVRSLITSTEGTVITEMIADTQSILEHETLSMLTN